MLEMRDVERQLYGGEALGKHIGAHITLPKPAVVGRVMGRLLDAIPRSAEHILVLPWLGLNGGSDRVSRRFIRLLLDHYAPGRLVILGLDELFDPSPEMTESLRGAMVSVNAIDRTLSHNDRVELLDRVLIERNPAVVHTVNSYAAWDLIRQRGQWFSDRISFFGQVYADIRIDGVPVEVFWSSLSDCIEWMRGVITDNANVVRAASRNFGLLPGDMAKFHVVRTPVLETGAIALESVLRPFRREAPRCSLWFSRLTPEKRPELLAKIAALDTGRKFVMYGARLPGTGAVELSAALAAANIDYRGPFASLADLPFDSFDSYIFTSSAEGVPLAILEATQHGLPVVAPDVGAIHEFLDNQTGWLLNATDEELPAAYIAALNEISANPDLASTKVRAAQDKLLAEHSWSAFEKSVAGIPNYLR